LTVFVVLRRRSLQVAEFLLAMFKKRQIVKRYWVITKSVPEPQQGMPHMQCSWMSSTHGVVWCLKSMSPCCGAKMEQLVW